MTLPSDVLRIQAAQIGTAENPNGSNVTPYSDWYGLHGAWCAMFQSWCFDQAGLPVGPGAKGAAWCSAMADWFESHGRLTFGTDGIRAGDVIFFEWGSTPGGYDHVGNVESVDGDWLTTIEGNVGNRVQRLVRHRTLRGVASYGRPAYALAHQEDRFMAGFSAEARRELEEIVGRLAASPSEITAIVVQQLGGINARLLRLADELESIAGEVKDIEAQVEGRPDGQPQLAERVSATLKEIRELAAAGNHP
jgi:hypothetical protein